MAPMEGGEAGSALVVSADEAALAGGVEARNGAEDVPAFCVSVS